MGDEHTLTVNASLDSLREVRDFLAAAGAELEIGSAVVADLQLAVDEAVTNIIMHGFAGRPGKVGVSVARDNVQVTVCLRDDAPLFDPTTQQRPDLETSPLERSTAGGFGVELVRQMVDELHYAVVDQQNQLTLVKKSLN